MKVGFLQTSPVFGDIEGNVDKACKRLSRMEADLMVLPELFSTGYQFCDKKEARSLAEEAGGYATERLASVARERNMHIVAGIAEKAGRKVFNSSVLVGPKGLISCYRKPHLFGGEKKVFSPGDTPFEVFDIGGARVGMMICFDWLFPEVSRALALKGADIICHPSNLVLSFCPDSMPVRCLENGVFAITANRIGTEERIKGTPLTFIGKSQVTGPRGEIIKRAPSARTASVIVEIDPKRARDKMLTPTNDILKDRRTDLF